MSLLEKASIITTPTAYDDGKLLSVKPVGGENLLLYSNQFDAVISSNNWINTNSSATSGQSGYDGSIDAWKIDISSSYAQVEQNVSNSGIQTFSIYAKAGTLNWVRLRVDHSTNSGTYFDLQNGVIGTRVQDIDSNIEDLGGGWYRCSLTFNNNTTKVRIYPAQADNDLTATSGNIYIQDVQLEKGKKANTYIETTTTAITNGDFSFQRGSSATRVNEQGLVQDVQILSDELVQNGDFEEIGSEEVSNGDFEQIGSEEVINGSFDADTDWIKNLNWSISGGVAIADGTTNNPLFQNGVVSSGKFYKVSFEIKSISQGSFYLDLGISTTGQYYSSIGTYTEYIKAGTTNDRVYIRCSGNAIGSIDNVSVKEVGQDWTFGTGWSIEDGKAISDGSANFSDLTQNNTNIVIGKNYKITYTVSDYVSGSFKFIMNNNTASGLERNANGTYTDYISALSQAYSFRTQGSGFNGSIDNISVKEVGQNWDFGTGWSMGDGVALHTGSTGNLITNASLTINKLYKVQFEIVSIADGVCNIYDTGSATTYASFTTIGLKSVYITKDSSNALAIRSNSSNVTIDNISVIEITDDTDLPRINYTNFDYQDVLGDELVTNGDFSDGSTDWSFGGEAMIDNGLVSFVSPSNTYSYIRQDISSLSASLYKITVEVKNYVSGAVQVGFTGSSPNLQNLNVSADGIYTVELSPNANGDDFEVSREFGGGAFDFDIDNVSVKELTEDVLVPYSGEGSLLLEPQSTNLLTYSEDFSQWSLGANSTLTFVSDIEAPDGSLGVYRLQNPQTSSTFLNAGIINCRNFSLFVKAVTEGVNNQFNFGEGQPTDTKTATTQWQRFNRDFGSLSNYNLYINNGIDNYASDIYIWGAQAEALSYATSYIPTEGSIKTRLADICKNAGSSDLINSTEGVLYAEIKTLTELGVFRQINLNDGTAANRIYISKRGNNNNLEFRMDNPLGSLSFSIPKNTTDNYIKLAFRYGLNNFAVFIDGLNQNVNPAGNAFSANTFNNLELTSPINQNFEGNVKCVAVFKEALSDEELSCLTS